MTMGSKITLIRTLDDFLNVPEAELVACLRTFRGWIEQRKALRSEAVRMGLSTASVQFEGFTWKPRPDASTTRPAKPYPPETDVRELGLRPSAMHRFRELNLYALEDFTQVSADQLVGVPDVGPATVTQLQEYLRAIGLDFKPTASPYRAANTQAKIARSLTPEQRRANVNDNSSIAALGLESFTINRCLEKGLDTVSKLRQLNLWDLRRAFGQKSICDIVESLDSVGLPLLSNPSQLEKWRFGAIRSELLNQPDDDADVKELQPWLGSLPDHLAKAGINTVGRLRAVAQAGGTTVRGLGRSSWERVFAHFK
jgi:DNA-directed RNA polymerase alpha subunit